jgi:MFS family permease
MVALWYVYYAIGFSVGAGVLFCVLDSWSETSHHDQKIEPSEPVKELQERFHSSLRRVKSSLGELRWEYWMIALVHCLFSLAFGLFFNISTHFISEFYSCDITTAGLYSSIQTAGAVVLAPVTGVIIDQTGGQLNICLCCAILTMFGFCVLGFPQITPLLPLSLMLVGEATVPTISLALIPSTCSVELYGVGTMTC